MLKNTLNSVIKPSTVCALSIYRDSIMKYLDYEKTGAICVVTFDMNHAFDSGSHMILLEGQVNFNFFGCVVLDDGFGLKWSSTEVSFRRGFEFFL